MKLFVIGFLLWAAAPVGLRAQQFSLKGHTVQFHGFVSQGFMDSDVNNYLTMPTSDGSFAFTDGGLTLATQITDRFRVGAQGYVRNVGKMGNGQVTLDWASGDYGFADWFGVRAGKVKTPLGLYNDSQDMEFLHPWALLPQSVYPLDLRSDTIAHTGIDIYGNIRMKQLGSLTYTVYGGKVPGDLHGGYVYGLTRSSRHINSYYGTMAGADLRWNTPIKGVLLGSSLIRRDVTADGVSVTHGTPYIVSTRKDHTLAFYSQYTLGNLRIDGEYRRNLNVADTSSVSSRTGLTNISTRDNDSRSGYLSASYRIAKWIQVGTYHSRFYVDWGAMHGPPNNHVFDQVVTARVDVNRYCDFKLEGHFIDGYGSSTSDRGFYSADNPDGKQPNTRLLVLRVGFHF